jgi:hypothetical protein
MTDKFQWTEYVMFGGKKRKKTTEYLILKKKNMKLTACMYIRGMIAYVRKYLLCEWIVLEGGSNPISPFVCLSSLLSLASERHFWL